MIMQDMLAVATLATIRFHVLSTLGFLSFVTIRFFQSRTIHLKNSVILPGPKTKMATPKRPELRLCISRSRSLGSIVH